MAMQVDKRHTAILTGLLCLEPHPACHNGGVIMHRLSAVLLAVASAAYAQAPAARIKIDIDRTIGEVHPHLFGNFAEHLGRMIYDGIYEEGSPLSDKDGYRTDVMEAVKRGKFPEDETKRLEKDVQAATDKAIKDITDHFSAKEKDLLAV